MWLRNRMELNVGMSSFIDEVLEERRPEKRALEERWQLPPGTLRARTVKSFCFQEAESISRTAKMRWCQRNGHAVLSLQHDGIVVAVRDGTSPELLREQLQEASEQALGYAQPCSIKPPEYAHGATPLMPVTRQQAEAQTQQCLGNQQSPDRDATMQRQAAVTWDIPEDTDDPQQYNALDYELILADPILRLHTRIKEVEEGEGVVCNGGVTVRLDANERTVMSAKTDNGLSTAQVETDRVLRISLDLHAKHVFTHAAAVDGSRLEDVHNGRPRCRTAYGIYTGAPRRDKLQQAMWGGCLSGDAQVGDAEMHAIYAYLHHVAQELGTATNTARVLIQSDCLGVLDAVETAWRSDATGLRQVDRGALLENICHLRRSMDRVIFLYTPSHKGIAPNAMADATAKAHLRLHALYMAIRHTGSPAPALGNAWQLQSQLATATGNGNRQWQCALGAIALGVRGPRSLLPAVR